MSSAVLSFPSFLRPGGRVADPSPSPTSFMAREGSVAKKEEGDVGKWEGKNERGEVD